MRLRFDVAIVGAGASGALTAAWLLRGTSSPLRIALLDGNGRFGTGVAYGTRDPNHLLNVPAARMSADPDDPEHLLRWVGRRGHPATAASFLPRALYGHYLQAFLARAEANAVPGAELVRIPHQAIGFRDGVFELGSGDVLDASQVVLALGNLPPAALQVPGFESLAEDPRYLSSPWSAQLREIDPRAQVTLLGSGLTAIDVLLSLRARGHEGLITLLSRHGRLPEVHAKGTPPPSSPPTEDGPRALLRWVRAQPDWRGAVDALRPHAQNLWKRWDPRERRQFHRHLRGVWDVHRHRMAPEIHETVRTLFETGAVQQRAGRIERVGVDTAALTLDLGARSHLTDVLINCTGPAAAKASPLIRSLHQAGLLCLEGGDLTTEDGQVMDASGEPLSWLHAIGPLRRAELFETTAMPEIRVQAKALAARILETLAQASGPRPRPPEPHHPSR